MTFEILLVFTILLITILLFIFELFPVDKIAFFIIVSLALTGLVSPEEAISGFSNSATIAVMALMMLAIAMEENGVIHWLTKGLGKLKSYPLYILAPVFMLVTAGISAFISTTAVVIVFIKIINQLSEKFKIPPSKLLLPVSFAGILGGSCTLMGTSTNLLVNSVALDLGADRLGFFEFSLFGGIFLLVSVVYLTLILRWLPWGSSGNLEEDYDIDKFITSVTINPGSELVGQSIEESFLHEHPEITLLKMTRNNRVHNSPGKYVTLQENDELLLMCKLENIAELKESSDLSVQEESEMHSSGVQQSEETDVIDQQVFVELLMLPGALFLGKTLAALRRMTLYNVTPIAIKKRKTLTNIRDRFVRDDSEKMVLKPGDRLLVEVERNSLPRLRNLENIVVLQEYDSLNGTSKSGRITSLLVLLAVIGLAASGLLTIMVSALSGVCLLLLTRNLDLQTVYKKLNWQIIFLLAGMIPLGVAMHNSGADMWISDELLQLLGEQPRLVVISSLFFVTMVLSGVVSNNATAIIMTPIAIALATGLQQDFKPFILAVMFAANFSFFTPVGYQTNTLIYGIGNYRFRHFLVIGGILSLLLWALASVLLSQYL